MWPCTCRMATKRLNTSFIARPHICSLAPTSTAGHATLWVFFFFFHFVAQQFQMMAPVITRVIIAAVFCAWHFTHNHSTNSHLSGAIEAAAFLPVSCLELQPPCAPTFLFLLFCPDLQRGFGCSRCTTPLREDHLKLLLSPYLQITEGTER